VKHIKLGLVGATLLITCAAHAETIRVDKSKQVATYSCAGEDVAITGDDNTLTITGSCRYVTISGSNNHVVLVQAQTIAMPGHDNVVSWKSGSPKLSNQANNHAAIEAPDTPHPTTSNANTDASQQTYGSSAAPAAAPPSSKPPAGR
jgi:hypothetical protein